MSEKRKRKRKDSESSIRKRDFKKKRRKLVKKDKKAKKKAKKKKRGKLDEIIERHKKKSVSLCVIPTCDSQCRKFSTCKDCQYIFCEDCIDNMVMFGKCDGYNFCKSFVCDSCANGSENVKECNLCGKVYCIQCVTFVNCETCDIEVCEQCNETHTHSENEDFNGVVDEIDDIHGGYDSFEEN